MIADCLDGMISAIFSVPQFLLCLLHVPSELLSDGDVENLLQVTGCSAELQTPTCQTDCLSERYRSVTGQCNNRSELV